MTAARLLVWLLIIGAAGAVPAAIVRLWQRVIRPIVQSFEAVHSIVKRELTPNGGGSMKDHTSLAASQLSQIQATQATTFAVFDHWSEKNQKEHNELWAAIASLGYERRTN